MQVLIDVFLSIVSNLVSGFFNSKADRNRIIVIAILVLVIIVKIYFSMASFNTNKIDPWTLAVTVKKIDGTPVGQAEVIIDFTAPSKASERSNTDTNGYVQFEDLTQNAKIRLTVQKDGFELYVQDVDLVKNGKHIQIQLKPTLMETVIAMIPTIATATNFLEPTTTPTFEPTTPQTPTVIPLEQIGPRQVVVCSEPSFKGDCQNLNESVASFNNPAIYGELSKQVASIRLAENTTIKVRLYQDENWHENPSRFEMTIKGTEFDLRQHDENTYDWDSLEILPIQTDNPISQQVGTPVPLPTNTIMLLPTIVQTSNPMEIDNDQCQPKTMSEVIQEGWSEKRELPRMVPKGWDVEVFGQASSLEVIGGCARFWGWIDLFPSGPHDNHALEICNIKLDMGNDAPKTCNGWNDRIKEVQVKCEGQPITIKIWQDEFYREPPTPFEQIFCN